MNSEIDKIIKQSSFKIEEGSFVYAKVAEAPNIENHFFISKDKDEITVVTEEKNLPELALIEKNKEVYRLVSLNVSVPFYAIGFIATVSQAIAKEGLNILVVSTYSKDYILVKDDRIEDARSVLLKLGFQEVK